MEQQIPTYEQVMRGAKTWLLTNPFTFTVFNLKMNILIFKNPQTQQPPSYSMIIENSSIEDNVQNYSNTIEESNLPPPEYQEANN